MTECWLIMSEVVGCSTVVYSKDEVSEFTAGEKDINIYIAIAVSKE